MVYNVGYGRAVVDQKKLELWGGHECTVNRVGDEWFDQTVRGGHENRIEDLALFADIGIRKLRYPALWERISPTSPNERDFRWTDERLPEIQRLGIEPILTLCHHGSGPHYTSLLEDSFATGLAQHAAAVAERYPWVVDYTPVNEPLTTARFSALYGYWYPHERDERACWLALLNEVDATRLAMRAIRKVNPSARLVQTDDLGFCHATPPLQAEADFQNHRRWMGWDLLCGMVVPGHALWRRLSSFGFEDRLDAISNDPCPPDVIGINHYLSSERLLDHRLELHGSRGLADSEVGHCNGYSYVDVDAQGSVPEKVVGLTGLLEQAWERYGLPIAITESHHGSTRDEQARWFIETWEVAEQLRNRGVDLRAVTAWSLLGSYDWNRMVTQVSGHYEPGVFDVRSGVPRPTLMAMVLRELSLGRRPDAPGLAVAGWWHDARRLGKIEFESSNTAPIAGSPDRLLLVGNGEALIASTIQACRIRGLHFLCVDKLSEEVITTTRPWAIFDTRDPKTRENSNEPDLGQLCQRHAIRGASIVPDDAHVGSDRPAAALQVVTGPLFGATEPAALTSRILDAIDAGEMPPIEDHREWGSVYRPCLVDGVLDLLLDGATGLVSFIPDENLAPADVARVLATIAQAEPLEGEPALPDILKRDINSGSYLPPIETVLERFVRDRRMVRDFCTKSTDEHGLEAAA
jgi:dTDP-4-dehydrorhamnose reductase